MNSCIYSYHKTLLKSCWTRQTQQPERRTEGNKQEAAVKGENKQHIIPFRG